MTKHLSKTKLAQISRMFMLACLFVACSACGQKGPLKLPETDTPSDKLSNKQLSNS